MFILLPLGVLLGSTLYHHSDHFKRQQINGDLEFALTPSHPGQNLTIPKSARILGFYEKDDDLFLASIHELTFIFSAPPNDLKIWMEPEHWKNERELTMKKNTLSEEPGKRKTSTHFENERVKCDFDVDEQAGTVAGHFWMSFTSM